MGKLIYGMIQSLGAGKRFFQRACGWTWSWRRSAASPAPVSSSGIRRVGSHMADPSKDASWDELYGLWAEVSRTPGNDFQRLMHAARVRMARNTADDWRWLAEALDDADRKMFLAGIFKLHPVPGRLLAPMVRAAVLSPHVTAGRAFIPPCVRSLGVRRVLQQLLRYLESGTDAEKAGAVSALYYAVDNPRDEDVADLRERLRCLMLREFVDNRSVYVRQRIIPSLSLEPEVYPQELRPLIPLAIESARAHPDEYIRHRVEVQLGADVLLRGIPEAGERS
jgi:hypothetical protein